MSAAAMSLNTVIVNAGVRGAAPRAGDGAEVADGKASFDQLIGNAVKTAAAEKGNARPGAALADVRVDQVTASITAETSVKAGAEAKSAKDGGAGSDSAAVTATTTPATDGSAVLAWLQASVPAATPAPSAASTPTSAAGSVGAAAIKGLAGPPAAASDSAGAAPTPAVSGARQTAGGAAAMDADASDDAGAESSIFHLPAPGASEAQDSAKNANKLLDTAVATALNAGAEARTINAATATPESLFAASVAGSTALAPAHPHAAVAASMGLPPALQSPLDAESRQLPQQIGERVQWLVSAGVQEARLQLHPRDLGSITVRIRMEAGSASVFFGAEHPAARAALEAALPQLREQFANGGMQLAQAQVSSQQSGGWSFGGSQTSGEHGSAGGNGAGRGAASGEGSDAPASVATARVVHIGLLDDYA